MNIKIRSIVKILILLIAIGCFHTAAVHASASVTLRWDANVPAPEGYRVFAREAGGSYDYAHPIWENSLTTCTLQGLVEGVTYHFVVRAYEGDLESVDSEEVSYTPPLSDTDAIADTDTDTGNDTETDSPTDTGDVTAVDRDGDNVLDSQDAFPDDPTEWSDNDNDGIGNNLDTDDDNDGMTDDWEIGHGTDPLHDDSLLDADNDGISNMDEFLADTGMSGPPDNGAPEAPVVENASEARRTSLTPVLVCSEYFDSDNDAHFQTRWQISTEADFSTLILDATSATQLYAYSVGDMLLDADTVYYWRAQFVDADHQASEWSDTASFTTLTIEGAGDMDLNGILDNQDAGGSSDVNENGITDALENGIMTFNTVQGQTTVGVESLSDTVTLVSVKSLSSDTIADKSVALAFGLVGFKLYLQEGVKAASVKIHFSKRVSNDAKLYKYTVENGWREYSNAEFAANRKSVTLLLEDGGIGDEDGVENGVIVDPSAIAYQEDAATATESAAVSTGDVASSGSASLGSCFITAGADGALRGPEDKGVKTALAMAMLLALGVASARTVRMIRVEKRRRSRP